MSPELNSKSKMAPSSSSSSLTSAASSRHQQQNKGSAMIGAGEQAQSDGQQLEVLNLSCCEGLDVAAFEHVQRLIYLRALTLDQTEVDAASLGFVANLPCLEELRMASCDTVDAEALAQVTRLRRTLRHLDVSGCQGVDGAAMLYIASLTRLEHLDLSGCSHCPSERNAATPSAFDCLGRLKKLQSLSLNSCSWITAPGLQCIATLPELAILKMSLSSVDGVGLQEIARAPRLRVLDIEGCRQTDAASIAAVRRLRLQVLKVADCCGA